MLNFFRKLSFLEGISFLIILFITMPLKYILEYPSANKIVGMAHGILFISYVVMVFMLKSDEKWNVKDTAIILLCSIIPFGTFWMDKRYLR